LHPTARLSFPLWERGPIRKNLNSFPAQLFVEFQLALHLPRKLSV
jgi:hypothetical protein